MMNQSLQNKTSNHYIDGQWISGQGDPLISFNPADGEIIWKGTLATSAEVKQACDAARQALPAWAALESSARIQYLLAFGEYIETQRTKLSELIAKETGKPLWEAHTEVTAVVGKIKLSIQAFHERTSEKQVPVPQASGFIRYKPHGVVAVLGPFNFPAHLSNGHIVPALLAGNTIVYKPSELTPAVAEFIMACWHHIQLPAGVLNCIQGDASTGQHLLENDIQGVYFTGSFQTGVRIQKHFAERPDIILALEMGGNNPLILDEVKHIQAAVYQSILSAFITAGQRCSCTRRLLIPNNNMGDQFLDSFIKTSQTLRIGHYIEKPEPFMGPTIGYQQALHHLKAQDKLIEVGGQGLLTMSLLKENTGFLSPGIIDMTKVKSTPDDEVFAPLVQIYRYDHFDDALALANQTQYGLVAGLFSDHSQHYQAFYNAMRAGLIYWNRPTTGALSSLPFGGIGKSGNHRPSAYFAADYCSYPIASLEQSEITLPADRYPGIELS